MEEFDRCVLNLAGSIFLMDTLYIICAGLHLAALGFGLWILGGGPQDKTH